MRFWIQNERSPAVEWHIRRRCEPPKILEMIGGEECPIHWDRDYDGGIIESFNDVAGERLIGIGIWKPVESIHGTKLGCVVTWLSVDKFRYIRWVYYAKDEGSSFQRSFWSRQVGP